MRPTRDLTQTYHMLPSSFIYLGKQVVLQAHDHSNMVMTIENSSSQFNYPRLYSCVKKFEIMFASSEVPTLLLLVWGLNKFNYGFATTPSSRPTEHQRDQQSLIGTHGCLPACLGARHPCWNTIFHHHHAIIKNLSSSSLRL